MPDNDHVVARVARALRISDEAAASHIAAAENRTAELAAAQTEPSSETVPLSSDA